MNPFSDALKFLTANTGDYNALGGWKYLILAIFYALIFGSLALAIVNWREDASQRTPRNLALALVRILIGCMWFEGMLWKLPFSHDNGLYYWMQQMAGRAAFAWHRDLVAHVLLPNFELLNPIIFLAELGFAAALILGLFVRLASLVAIGFTLNLWLGIYQNRGNDPAEWSWSYMFLALLLLMFILDAAGRALGADAWLARNIASVRDGQGLGRWAKLAG
ncbi:MAG: DoxX family membrane protein [Hyphomicrobiales bacterium]|nr:DoxX family membrane protein [Hyphomicrobiales bacterium]MDE2114876.1 DoxX family membrane protein [Hyphomicrobiales bacterium]